MPSLKTLRARGSHLISQDEGDLLIIWRARHIDPAALFQADALISALFDLSNSGNEASNPGEGGDLDDAERMARSANQTEIEKQRDELASQQKIARSVVKEISTDEGNSWRSVEWVDSEDQEADPWEAWSGNSWEPCSAEEARETISAGGQARELAIRLHIGWISRKSLTTLILKSGVRLKEEEGSRFRRSESEE